VKACNVVLVFMVLTGCARGVGQGVPQPEQDLTVWNEFAALLEAAPFPGERIKPYQEGLREATLRVLEVMRQQARWQEWTRTPEVFRVGQQIHYVLPLTFDSGTDSYSFSFLMEQGSWYLQHVEGIQLRLDNLGPLPVSEFPDLPEETKAWMRAEVDATHDVWLYRTIAAERGADVALTWLLDGAGYALAGRAWIPFVSPEEAFVLYACWEQSRLRGNSMTLELLQQDEAVIRMRPMWFQLYQISGHLRQQIEPAEYRRLFEARWRDRARHGGWSVEFSYDGNDVVLHLGRRSEGQRE
jgi:hypothetical protein